MRITATSVGGPEVRAALHRLGQSPRLAVDRTAEDIEDAIEAEAARHNRSGALVRSIFKRREAGGWFIGHDPNIAPHARFVHWGTRPHLIVPKRKKALRWPSGGRFFFARKVNHPGNRSDAWLVRVARLAPQFFHRHIAELLAARGG